MRITFIKFLGNNKKVMMKHLRTTPIEEIKSKTESIEKNINKLKYNKALLKKNQAVLIAISFMLVTAGYLNYTNKVKKAAIGDAQLVSTVPAEKEVKISDDYFIKTKLEREKMYSQMLETYNNILTNTNISNDQKGVASAEIKNINDRKNAILNSENLINSKNFNDSVILVNDNNIDVVIKSIDNISKEQVAQIQNIVSRELKAKIEDIHITTHA